MSFLGKIFKGVGKVVGGLGKVVAGVATTAISNATGGVIDLTPKPKVEEAPASAPVVNNGVFAGASATLQGNTIAMSKPLDEVNISVPRAKSTTMPAWVNKIGDIVSNLGGRATEQASVGVDNKTLLVAGAIGLGLILVLANNKK